MLMKVIKEELRTAMQLVGITDLAEASPDLVNTVDIGHLICRSEKQLGMDLWTRRRGSRL